MHLVQVLVPHCHSNCHCFLSFPVSFELVPILSGPLKNPRNIFTFLVLFLLLFSSLYSALYQALLHELLLEDDEDYDDGHNHNDGRRKHQEMCIRDSSCNFLP